MHLIMEICDRKRFPIRSVLLIFVLPDHSKQCDWNLSVQVCDRKGFPVRSVLLTFFLLCHTQQCDLSLLLHWSFLLTFANLFVLCMPLCNMEGFSIRSALLIFSLPLRAKQCDVNLFLCRSVLLIFHMHFAMKVCDGKGCPIMSVLLTFFLLRQTKQDRLNLLLHRSVLLIVAMIHLFCMCSVEGFPIRSALLIFSLPLRVKQCDLNLFLCRSVLLILLMHITMEVCEQRPDSNVPEEPVTPSSHVIHKIAILAESISANPAPGDLQLGICSCSMRCYHPMEPEHAPYCMYCDPRHCPAGCCCPCAMCYPDSDTDSQALGRALPFASLLSLWLTMMTGVAAFGSCGLGLVLRPSRARRATLIVLLVLLRVPIVPGAALTHEDVLTLLSWSRPLQLGAPAPMLGAADYAVDLITDFPWVPGLVLALLVSLMPDSSRLRRMLSQDWACGWRGWGTSRAILDACSDVADEEATCLECIQDFARISLQNVDAVGKSDALRKAELQQQGKHLGVGLVHGNNECCADSLLQLLARQAFVGSHFANDVEARREACRLCRAHLVHHVNQQFHPKHRTATGAVADVSDAEHDAAYLQHDVHGRAIVDFFVEAFPGRASVPPGGLLVLAYTRWDSLCLPAESNSVVVGRSIWADAAGLAESSVKLEMYNNSGGGYTGYHYDPVFEVASTDFGAPGAEPSSSSNLCDLSCPPPPAAAEFDRPRKRLRQKTASDAAQAAHASGTCASHSMGRASSAQESDHETQHFFSIACLEEGSSPDPRSQLESEIQVLCDQMRDDPTLPADPEDATQPSRAALREDAAVELPPKHCAFKGCAWSGTTDAELVTHLSQKHVKALGPATALFHASHSSQERCVAAYNAGITAKVRMGAPLACYAIDRRCMYNYVTQVNDATLDSLICFCCARRYPHISTLARNEIRWVRPCADGATFLGLGRSEAESILGHETYMRNYGHCDGDGMPDLLGRPEEFEDWALTTNVYGSSIRLLCCPEDLKCVEPRCKAERTCCELCEIPVCTDCESFVCAAEPKMPPAALTNDMMIFYAPKEIYTANVTVVEMVCASVCITSMICCTLELKHRRENPFDTEVHMARHRMGARGNATSFPLPWSSLLSELLRLDAQQDGQDQADLPWTGEQLADKISVLLKTNDEDHAQSMANFVHQALVRREVVLQLIQGAKDRGHRAYANLDMVRVGAKAQSLPEHGVPPELIRILPHDDDLDKVLVQKAATPTAGRSDLEGAGHALSTTKPNAVVLEKSSFDDADINAQRHRALHHLVQQLGITENAVAQDSKSLKEMRPPLAKRARPGKAATTMEDGAGLVGPSASATEDADDVQAGSRVQPYVLATGNAMVDQFNSWYFGVAFAFLFKYCTGMPDMPAFAEKQRYRRVLGAPRIEPTQWVKVMARRVEAQMQRDWHFGFVSWNYVFRSAINFSRTLYSYENVNTDGGKRSLSAKELEEGAISICKALRGNFKDQDGKMRGVNGDMTKIRYVPGLSIAAKRLLQNLEHTSRKIPGTQEVRRVMRFAIHGYRVKYGVPLFVTFSPDEAHNLVMVRLSRTRKLDPVLTEGRDIVGKYLCGRGVPSIEKDYSDDVFLDIPLGDLAKCIPTHDQRRVALSRDSLASVDGFRVLVLAAYKFLWGLNVCMQCPDCNFDDSLSPCQDICGSSSSFEGGINGRAEAAVTCVEAQKGTGSLHAHCQVFVQCLHQHTALSEVLERIRGDGGDIVRKYLRYKSHVCRQVYADEKLAESRLPLRENDWPQYEKSRLLVSRPAYLSQRDNQDDPAHSVAQGQEWLLNYVTHVQELQEHKQHHVHPPNDKGERVPLTHCKRKDNPTLCKSEFPRTLWLIDQAVVLCKGLLQKMGMACSGRRSKLGSMHGPMNNEWLNGTSPAMLAVQQFNSDIQLPYRFPVTPETHSELCCEECCQSVDENTIVQAAQFAQDAAAGYACDYCSKRQPMAFNEVRECCKGHQTLNQKLQADRINYIGKRHASRFMSDAYGKGIVRGQAENTNLRANSKAHDVLHAEFFGTSMTESFLGREYLKIVESLNDQKVAGQTAVFAEVDARNPKRRKVTIRDVAMLYGQRPKHPDLWTLSPYEFTMYWEPVLATYPLSIEEADQSESHVDMKPSGLLKLRKQENDLIPGTDYTVKGGGTNWLPFPDVPSTKHFRHTWVLIRRQRPRTPTFFGSPVPRHSPGEQQRAACIVMSYFHPWTLRKGDADQHVSYAGELRKSGESWQDALQLWLDGSVVCQEAKRHVGNFLVVHRVRPGDEDSDGGNSDDIASDEELEVSRSCLEEALATRIGGRERQAEEAEDDVDQPTHHQNSASAISLNQDIWSSQLDNVAAKVPQFLEPETLQDILKEARSSQRKDKAHTASPLDDERDPTLRKLLAATAKDVQAWLDKKKIQKNDKGKALLNAEQYVAVEKIARRVMQELRHAALGTEDFGEPLRWLVHGGPGTGKSHVIKQIKELFVDVLHWDIGVQFQIVALQAVMADQLGGDTIHHACGIPVFNRGNSADSSAQRQMDVAKRVLQWRWLIIDEISMVSARLLADVDVKLRSTVRQLGTQKLGAGCVDRPFGGLNVLCCGDFYQLDPPDGGCLADIPTQYIQAARKYMPAPTVAHGQALFWSGPADGIQGVTELVQCERCQDPWLQEVQEEFRYGRLSQNSHNFLHGFPTSVPGSWVGGDAACGNDSCRRLATAYLDLPLTSLRGKRKLETEAASVLQGECDICRQTRKSRCRVAKDPADFQADKFATAPAIFANNDVKYDANKSRAQRYANDNGKAVTFSCAKDTPSNDAVREKPGLAAEKLAWLQRHDRETGDLYGALPLVHNMPMALTDHIDRNPEKQLLRGKICHLHSWVVQGEETSEFHGGVRILSKLPKVAFVKFEGATWTLPGLTEPGLYPVCPKKSSWFLDKSRKVPRLKISRQQLPLAPAFAITAHASQGQTLFAAIVDLQIGSGTKPISSYVALTRVRELLDLLIYRAFDRHLFTKGCAEGPELLLKTLRGEYVDWRAIEEKHTPSKRCVLCSYIVFKQDFPLGQWNRKDKLSCCKTCIEHRKQAGTPHECTSCHFWKSAQAFDHQSLSPHCFRRICVDCLDVQECLRCKERKTKNEFSKHAWRIARDRVCLSCAHPEVLACSRCDQKKEQGDFSKYAWRTPADRVCLLCTHPEVLACLRCKDKKKESDFSKHAWQNPRDRVCLLCIHPEVHKCIRCEKPQEHNKFSPYAWTHPRGRICHQCVKPDVLQCLRCGTDKQESEFSADARKHPVDRVCNACLTKRTGKWRCLRCKYSLDVTHFTRWLAPRKCKNKHNGSQRCNQCMEKDEQALRKSLQEAAAHVEPKS